MRTRQNSKILLGAWPLFLLFLFVTALRSASAQGVSQNRLLTQGQLGVESVGTTQTVQVPRRLEPGKPVERNITAGRAHSYGIALAQGQFLHLTVVQPDTADEVQVTLYGPGGKLLVFNSNSISLVAEVPGVYLLKVYFAASSLTASSDRSRYKVEMEESRTPTTKDWASTAAFRIFEAFRDHDVTMLTPESRQTYMREADEALRLCRQVSDHAGEALALTYLGRGSNASGEYQKALNFFSSALRVYRQSENRRAEAGALFDIGASCYLPMGETEQAIGFLRESLQIWLSLGNSRKAAREAARSGLQLARHGDIRMAVEFYNQALESSQAAKDCQAQASYLTQMFSFNASLAFTSRGEYQKLLDHYSQALQQCRDSGAQRQEVSLLEGVATFYQTTLRENRKAIDFVLQALQPLRALGDREGEAQALVRIGAIYQSAGDDRIASQYFDQAVGIWHGGDDSRRKAATLREIGRCYSALNEHRRALDHYIQSLAISRAIGDPRYEAIALSDIAAAYASVGNLSKASDHYNQAFQLSKQSDFKGGIPPDGIRNSDRRFLTELVFLAPKILNEIGKLYYSTGEYQKAIDYYNQALEMYRRRALLRDFADALTLINIGLCYTKLGETQKGRDYYHLGLQELQGPSATNRPSTISEKAVQYIEAPYISMRFEVVNEIADVYTSLRLYEQAIEFRNQALELSRISGDRVLEARALFAIARFERDRDNVIEAKREIEAAVSIIELLRTNFISPEHHSSYLSSVREFYDFYIDLLMRLHKQRPTQGFDALALEASERARARSLLELLIEARADIRRGIDPALLKRQRELQLQISAKEQYRMQRPAKEGGALSQEIAMLIAEYQQLETQIRVDSPHYAALTQPRALSLRQIQQKLLDEDTLLLEYSLGTERSFLWAVTANSISSHLLAKRETIEGAARTFCELLTARSSSRKGETRHQQKQRIAHADSQLPRAAQQLSEMVLGPTAAQLGTKRLLIVTEGGLQYVPFAALPKPKLVQGEQPRKHSRIRVAAQESGRGAYAFGAPLIFYHEIINLPSASTLAVQRKELAGRRPAPKLVAMFADPVFQVGDDRLDELTANVVQPTMLPSRPPSEVGTGRIIEHLGNNSRKVVGMTRLTIPRLPFTLEEAENILALAPSASNLRAVAFKANKATATSPELSAYQFVHFATHGHLDAEVPQLSAIVLSMIDEQGKPQDGFLRATEIYNLNLPAELVVLSACQTGLGKDIRGEGLIGLTRGFMYAGAARVVVSLWNVNDKATSKLMVRFYRGMLTNGRRPAAALRTAQVEMWKQKQWQSPYYWAAFILQGEWK